MADITVTASAVKPANARTRIEEGIAGDSISAGQAIYADPADSYKLKRALSTTQTQAQNVVGIALNTVAVDQPLDYVVQGDVSFNSVLTAGTIYVLGGTAGGISPSSDLTGARYGTILGIADSATNLRVGVVSSGVNSGGGSSGFYRAINLNGPSLTIDGNAWEADPTSNFTTNGFAACDSGLTLNPATDTNRDAMIRCFRWNQGLTLTMSAVPNGSYDVYIYTLEDDWPTTFGVTLEGTTVATDLVTGVSAGAWNKYGPWQVTISDGSINLAITGGNWTSISGFEVWSVT